jgi:ubiquinone/menaquinone biosynthesis C-methylase UbiE
MGWQGAGWLEREEREVAETPEALLDLFELQPGDTVADLGCGTGYLARRMARRVAPEGKVYCVDIQPRMLELMRRLAPESAYPNLVPVLAEEDDPRLPEGHIDFVLLVDVYHEIQEPDAMLARLRQALAPGGRVGLVEYRLEGRTAEHIRREHRMSVEQVLAEWLPAGFELVERFDAMPSQHVFVFRSRELAP